VLKAWREPESGEPANHRGNSCAQYGEHRDSEQPIAAGAERLSGEDSEQAGRGGAKVRADARRSDDADEQ
jgi:hypothetical protein